jgi:predicted AlkP superfamily phosphohydrolase/phosphomutase
MMTPSLESAWVYPSELASRLLGAIGEYVINIETQHYRIEDQAGALRFLDEVLHAFRQRREALYFLMDHETWDLLIAVFILPDRIQHKLWKYLDPTCSHYAQPQGRTIREAALRCYQEMDETLGQLRGRLGEGDYLCLMSDHGFGPLQGYFCVNTWLSRQGFLRFKRSAGRSLRSLIKPVLPRSIKSRWQRRQARKRSLFRASAGEHIDWSRTQAYFSSSLEQGIRLCDRARQTPASDVVTRLIKTLLEIEHPADGQPIVDQIHPRETIYEGRWVELAPDLSLVARNYSYLGISGTGDSKVIIDLKDDSRGFHRPDGLFLILGPGIRSGEKIEGARIIDLAPTILFTMQEVIPDDMDGHVLRDCFGPIHLKTFVPRYVQSAGCETPGSDSSTYSDEEAREVESRLKALGYLDGGSET